MTKTNMKKKAMLISEPWSKAIKVSLEVCVYILGD